jgi:hypothetical protein
MDTDRLLDAASRTRDLQNVARAYHRANETMKKRRHELHEAVVDSVLLLGMSKSEAARISGYTREYVAKLCDERTTDSAES